MWLGGAAGGASIRLLWDLADGMTSLGLRVGTLFTKLPYGSCDGEPFFGTSSICGKAGTPTFTTLMSVAFVAEIRVASFASVEVVGGLHFEPVPRTWPFPGVVFGAAAVFDLYQGETATLFARVGADVYLVQVAALFPQAGFVDIRRRAHDLGYITTFSLRKP